MAGNREPCGLINHHFSTAVSGLFLAVSGALLSKTLLIICQENAGSISILLAIYTFLFLFLPLTFFINMVLLLAHVATRVTGVGESLAPLRFFFLRYLRRAAQTVSVGTLLLGFPLSLHVALTDDSGVSATGPCLVCLAMVTVLVSSFCRTCNTAFAPAFFALSTSTSLLLFINPLLSFSNRNRYNPLIDIPIHVLTFFLIPFTFMLGIALLILCVTARNEEQQAATRAERLVTVGTLSAAYATLLVGMYTMAHVAVTNMAVTGGGIFQVGAKRYLVR